MPTHEEDPSPDHPAIAALILVARFRPGPRVVFHFPAYPTTSAAASPSDGPPAPAQPDDPSAAIFGLSELVLERLLAPGCWSDGAKFVVGAIDGLTFVGHPVFAARDGAWDRPHSHDDDDGGQPGNANPTATADRDAGVPIATPQARPRPDAAASIESQPGSALGTSYNSASTASGSGAGAGAPEQQLTMFHVVAAVRTAGAPPGVERAVYAGVVEKLARALHFCQRQASYVAVESRRLLARKVRGRHDGLAGTALWTHLLRESELARALQSAYEGAAAGAVADLLLNGMCLSVQLPDTRTTTAHTLGPADAILLLHDKPALLRALAHHPDTSPLARLIRAHTPTKSLQKHAAMLGIPVPETLRVARHLVTWRKARPTLPLSPWNTYVVGATPPQRLADALPEHAARFPALPALPHMLKLLGGKPVKYGRLIPSRDHRAPFMDMLAWMLRRRLLVPLPTFAWLTRGGDRRPPPAKPDPIANRNRLPLPALSLLSPQLRPVDERDDAASVHSDRTTVPDPASPAPRPDDAADVVIIPNPLAPSPAERAALQHIRASCADPELADRLPALYKYFDGATALEELAAREGLKRALVERWLELLLRQGALATFRRL